MNYLVRHIDELEEDFRSKDLLNRSENIFDYSINKLDKIQKSGIVGLIGPFGCGKTTFINQIINSESKIDSGSKWLNFDAWKYPDRKDLWENFILDMAEKLDKKGKELVFDKLQGKPTNIFEAAMKDGIDYLTRFVPNIRGYLFDKGKRELYVIESLLKEIFIALHTCENGRIIPNIYTVIEDIDRSGDAGVYFLQTLNYFLKKINLGTGLKVIGIATIGSNEYRGNLNSYLKCVDYIHNFPVPSIDYIPMLKYFLDEKCYNNLLGDFINYVGSHYEGFTPRVLKHILRDLLLLLQELEINENDYCFQTKVLTIIGVLTAKYLNIPGEKITYLDKRKKEGVIAEDTFKSFFLSAVTDNSFVQKTNGIYVVSDPNIYNNISLGYSFYDFGDNDKLISISTIPGQGNGNVYVDKKLLYS